MKNQIVDLPDFDMAQLVINLKLFLNEQTSVNSTSFSVQRNLQTISL
jgi:hypothetical protein